MHIPHYTEIDAYLAHYKDMRRKYILSHGWYPIHAPSAMYQDDNDLVWYGNGLRRDHEEHLYNQLKSKDPFRISDDVPGASYSIDTDTGPVKFHFAELGNQTYWRRWA